MPAGITLRDIQRSQACMVTDCPNHTLPEFPFCRSCYAAMPKRARRNLIRLWKENPLRQEVAVKAWYLIATRLAKRCRQQSAALAVNQETWNKYREVAQLYDMGVTLERVSTMAIENHRLREALDTLTKAITKGAA